MPKLLQIDSCLGIGSTGRIAENIAGLMMAQGWECYMAHGARYIGSSRQKSIQILTKNSEYLHAVKSMLFDNHGLNSTKETKRLIEKIRQIQPDIIQLHCIHGYYLNYKILFEYLAGANIPVVWTFHDTWAFTGHCAHFDFIGCSKWKIGCYNCPQKNAYPSSILLDRSRRNFLLKKELFTSVPNMHIVCVSKWLKNLVQQSFFAESLNIDISVINNGVDLSKFKPIDTQAIKTIKKKIGVEENNLLFMGCASAWGTAKGLYDLCSMSTILPDNVDIILVGLNDKQLNELPPNIKGIKRTESLEMLTQLYNAADVFLNPTYQDTFPTVNIEALACGTPVITYDTGGSPEIIDKSAGYVCEKGDWKTMLKLAISMSPKTSQIIDKCRLRAEDSFDMNKCFNSYVSKYNNLIK